MLSRPILDSSLQEKAYRCTDLLLAYFDSNSSSAIPERFRKKFLLTTLNKFLSKDQLSNVYLPTLSFDLDKDRHHLIDVIFKHNPKMSVQEFENKLFIPKGFNPPNYRKPHSPYDPRYDGSVFYYCRRIIENNAFPLFSVEKHYQLLWNEGLLIPDFSVIRVMWNTGRDDEHFLVVNENTLQGIGNSSGRHSGRPGTHSIDQILHPPGLTFEAHQTTRTYEMSQFLALERKKEGRKK